MTGPEFKAWREGFGLTQSEIADKYGVARATIQNWEATPGELPRTVEIGQKVLDRQIRQEDPARGPVTLVYTDGPMHIDPYGPRRPLAMMKQETHRSNAAVLARARMLSGRPDFWNPFVLEEGAHDLWNLTELQHVIGDDYADGAAPTLANLLRRIAVSIREDAPRYVRTGPNLATEGEVAARAREFDALAVQLERIAEQPLPAIVGEQADIEGILGKVRKLGLRPKDKLADAIAQSLNAARMPTTDMPNQVY